MLPQEKNNWWTPDTIIVPRLPYSYSPRDHKHMSVMFTVCFRRWRETLYDLGIFMNATKLWWSVTNHTFHLWVKLNQILFSVLITLHFLLNLNANVLNKQLSKSENQINFDEGLRYMLPSSRMITPSVWGRYSVKQHILKVKS